MDIKNEILILVGKAGSGKTYIEKKLVEKGLKSCLKWTTRPQRELEEQGVNYNFVSESNFTQLLNENKFIVNQKFYNDKGELWRYGVLWDDFNTSQVFIMTPGEVSQIVEERKKCFVVYLDIDRETRENRLFIRKDNNDSIVRRLDADDIDFYGFSDYDLKITDPLFSVDDILSLMN